MGTIERFEDLEIWKLSRVLVREVYEVTRKRDFSKDYGLKDQIRPSSVSVMNNISEGFESRTNKLFINYLGRSKASSGETRSVLYVALDCGYITESEFRNLYEQTIQISRRIQKLISYLESYSFESKVRDTLSEYGT